MDILVDTGVILRLTIASDPGHTETRLAIKTLKTNGDRLITMTQNAAEFWNVCTRPATARGGYGLSHTEAARKLRLIERLVEIRPDSLTIFQEWKQLLLTYSISGVQVYDARLVAAMQVFGIPAILTFNGTDFRRYAGITIYEPKDIR